MTQAIDLGAIVDQARSAYRPRVNENVQALTTWNSGISAPSPSYPFMSWIDTAAGKVKMRDAANTVWLVVGDLGPPIRWISSANVISVKAYGAVGNGVADDTAAITSAIAAMPAGGGRLYFPSGIYKVSSAVTLNKAGVYYGDGDASILRTSSATANTLNMTVPGITVSHLSFDSSTTRSGGSYVYIAASDVRLTNFFMSGAYVGVLVADGYSNIKIANGYLVNGVATNGIGVQVNGSAYISIGDLIMDSTPNTGVCIRITKGSNISIVDSNLIHGDVGLDILPGAGDAVSDVFSNNCFYDTSGSYGIRLLANGAFSSIVRCNFNQCWFSSSGAGSGMVLQTASGGVVKGVDIDTCHGFLNAGDGITIADSGVTNVRVQGGAYAQNTSSGIGIANGVNEFCIIGVRSGATHGLSGNAYGAFVTGTSNNYYTIVNNDFRGNGTAGLSDSGTGVNKVVTGNL